MKKLVISSIFAISTLCAVGAASACVFDSDYKKCFNQCTEAGYLVAPICAFGSTHNG